VVSVDSGFSDYRTKKSLIGPRGFVLDWLAFAVNHFMDDNLKWLVAIGATHTLLLPSALLKLPVGGVAFLTMTTLNIFHRSSPYYQFAV